MCFERLVGRFFMLGVLVYVLIVDRVKGQETHRIEEQVVEQLMEEIDEGVDVSQFTERLRYYLKYPIDINNTDGSELAELLFLSPLQITALLHHREVTGRYISVLELQGVSGFDLYTIELLLPFISVDDKLTTMFNASDVWKNSDQQLLLRYGRIMERQRGYQVEDPTRSRYLGDPNRYMLRYRMNYQNNLRLAINMEKDAGEPIFKHKQRYGFDHYGFSLYARNIKVFKAIVIGDYAMQVGQGLAMWNGLSFGKGAMITSSARQAAGLQSYSSMNEHNYLRGLAASLSVGRWEVSPFLSWRNLSGNVETNSSLRIIKSLSTTGLHRTPSEQRNRHAVKQFTSGAELRYSFKRFQAGVLAVYNRWNGQLTPDESLRNIYAFRGANNTNVAVNYQYTFRNIYLYGESAKQLAGGWATNNGVIASLDPKLSLFLNYRNYKKDYYAAFAQTLGETRATNNETGVYTGVVYHPSRRISWLSYIDLFKFPWLRYRVDAPSTGADFLSQLSHSWYKIGEVAIRYRYRLKQENSSATTSERYVVDTEKHQLRLNFKYKLDKKWELRSRVEGLLYDKESQRDYGLLIYQDVFWKPSSSLIQLNGRVAVFHTDSYEARIYAYENDVLHASSFPLYNNKGWRAYLNCRYRIGHKIDFWLRYALSNYSNQDIVGSGLEQSEGNKRSDIKIQFRYQW